MIKIYPLIVMLITIYGLSSTSIVQADSNPAAGLTATAQVSVSPPSVTLSWNAITGTQTYFVYRDFQTLVATTANTSFVDTNVAAGQTHSYFVVSQTNSSSFPFVSNVVSITVSLAAPQGLTATGVWNPSVAGSGLAGPEVDLAWQACAGATGYNVYRGGVLLQSGLTQGQFADTSVTSGQTYSYTVSAVGPGGEGAQSAAVNATAPAPPAPAAPAAPQGLTATPQWVTSCPKCGGMAMGHIVLAWTAVVGATGYNVYRNGSLLDSGLTAPTDTDMSVTSGQTYSYSVSAVGPGGEGAQSAAVNATAPAPPASAVTLTSPTNLSVQGFWNAGANDMLSWDPVPGAVSYNVYQYDTLIAPGVTGTKFLVPPSLIFGSLTYTVTAVDAMGMESIPSAPAAAQGAQNPAQTPVWLPGLPPSPKSLAASSEWNAGLPRTHLTWRGNGGDYTYNVYRDGQLIAAGLWGLAYYDNTIAPGETHTYSVTGVNVPWTTAVESAPSVPATATALAAAPALSAAGVQITNVQANDDSAVITFAPVAGAKDYRVYKVGSSGSVKYSGGSLSIEMNGLDPTTGADLIVEAVDKLGPFQKMDGQMGPGAMQMDGTITSSVNGQGDPSDVPNVIAQSAPFHVTCQPRTLTGDQVFFDNFRTSQPFIATPVDPVISQANYGCVTQVENDKWVIRDYNCDQANSKVFVMGNHFMDTTFDGPTARVSRGLHVANASMIMMPKATADISGGRVLHVTFEVDAHFNGRRWCDLFVGAAGDPLLIPGKFSENHQFPTQSGNLLRWQIEAGSHAIGLFRAGVGTNLNPFPSVDPNWGNDYNSIARVGWNGASVMSNGTAADLDKRHKFDLYLSQTRYRLIETTPNGKFNVMIDKNFPPGVSLPFTNVQIYLVHQVYHTAEDRPEVVTNDPADAYWSNYRPYSDERHWDNIGFEVLSAFPN